MKEKVYKTIKKKIEEVSRRDQFEQVKDNMTSKHGMGDSHYTGKG